MTNIHQKVNELFRILAASEDMEYIGEPISQLQHALQAAQCGIDSKFDNEMIIAALLHDIGHLIKSDSAEKHESVGVINHNEQGELYLRTLGFPEKVIALVGGHVKAKRYLVATNPSYAKSLSTASIKTLELQGGPMSAEEVSAFRNHPYFHEMLQIRGWDERAKEVDKVVTQLEDYRSMITHMLEKSSQGHPIR